MGKSKGKAQVSGFSGRTIGKMIAGSKGGSAPSGGGKKPGGKKKK